MSKLEWAKDLLNNDNLDEIQIEQAKWLIEQAEENKKLEEIVKEYGYHQDNAIKDLSDHAIRFKTILEEIKDFGTYGTDIKTNKIVRSAEAEIAQQALKEDD